MKQSEKVAQELAQKRQAASEIWKKVSENPSDENLKEFETANAEVKTIKTRHDALLAAEKEAESNEAELKKLNETPVNALPHQQKNGEPQAKVLGFQNAGESIFERGIDADGRKFLELVYEEGELGLDKKTRELISSRDYKMAYRNYLRKGKEGLTSDERKTLQQGSDTAGGFVTPDDILSTIIQKKPTPTRVAARVERLQTSRDNLQISKVNYTTDNKYTTGMRVTWTTESPSSGTAHRVTDPAFGQVRIPIHTAMMSLPLTLDMIEDAAFPIVSWASMKFAETIELLKDDMVLNGSGIGQPAGILMNPGGANQPEAIISGDANTLTADGIIDLGFALPEQYDENAVFVFNKTSTGKTIAKLKDDENRYLWGAGLQDSGLVPSIKDRKLLGYDTMLSAFMPNVAANAFPIVFGDPRGYYLVDRIGFSIQVLRERYAEENQVVLLGRVRFGGQVVEDWRLKVQKVANS